jgi:two-component system, cell cycle sensor histidine kinase and response regulator CckA
MVQNDDFRLLFDANPRPMFVSDRETLRFLEVNRAACELYGWSRDELLAMTLRDIRPPEELPHFAASYADPNKDKAASYSRTGRHHTKSGVVLEIDMQITTVTFAEKPASLVVITNMTGIRDAERRFKLLVEHSGDGISLTNTQNVLEYISPGGLRILGYNEADVRDKDVSLIAHPDDVQRWQPPAPGETKHNLARIKHRDGSWRWIESSTTNLTHDPVMRAFVTNYRDITRRVEQDNALRETKQRFEFLLSATSAVTYTARVSGDFGNTFIGHNVTEMLGYQPEDFYAPSFWYSNIHPDDVPGVSAVLARLPDEEPSAPLQYRFRHRDGDYRWLRDSVRVIRDAAGNRVELVGYIIDVTDAVRAEDVMRRSERKFSTLIERAPVATFVHHNGHYVYLNPAAVALLGYTDPKQIVGKSVLANVHPDDREALGKKMQRLDETGSASFSGLRLVRDDGSTLVLEGQAMLLDFDGVPCHVVMGHDVSERDAVFARIAMADRMLSIGTLAAGVAHELNNPLAWISANLELLSAELPNLRPISHSRLTDTTLHCLVTDAREGVARVNAIVRDLRSLSRPDEQKQGPVDVLQVLASSLKMTHNETRHRARVVQDHASDLPLVDGDASRLGQVFVNLLLNGAQAIAEGHADENEIRIRTSTTPDGKRVRIDISDTGAGIPSPIIARIFDPFFTTKAPGAGIGLGLAISHQIVNSMGGEIRVESHAGTGSTFSVFLRIASTAAVNLPRAKSPSSVATRRILLVDDEAAVGRSLQMLLAPETEVVPVICAEDALAQLVTGESFDAILCDLMMPRSSGMQFYEQIASDAPQYMNRIIFMTGGAFTPQARDFLSKLQRPHLEKPFSEQELREAIASVIG